MKNTYNRSNGSTDGFSITEHQLRLVDGHSKGDEPRFGFATGSDTYGPDYDDDDMEDE